MTKKEEYERLIDSSILFSLDREKEYSKFSKEENNLIKNIYLYLMEINRIKYEPFGLQILETAKRCIKNYDPASGRFLNFFSAAWKKNYKHAIGKEIMEEEFGGIHFSEGTIRNFRKVNDLLIKMGNEPDGSEFDKKIAETMGISVGDVAELRKLISLRTVSGETNDDDGEEYSIFDQIDSGKYVDSDVLQVESIKEILDSIEHTFDQLQDRQKPMISMLATSKISLQIGEDMEIIEFFKSKSFYDDSIYKESVSRGEQIQAKEIAVRFGVAEASISRTWKTFISKIKQKK